MSLSFPKWTSQLAAFLLLQCMAVQAFAQDKGLDIDIDLDKDDEWYKTPWAAVGGVLLLILVILAVRGKK